jgi:hypothetical protein
MVSSTMVKDGRRLSKRRGQRREEVIQEERNKKKLSGPMRMKHETMTSFP